MSLLTKLEMDQAEETPEGRRGVGLEDDGGGGWGGWGGGEGSLRKCSFSFYQKCRGEGASFFPR